MAGFLRSGTAVLLLVCFISQSYCHLSRTAKALNHADKHKYPGCDSLLKAGYNVSGVYRLTLNKEDVEIPCKFVDGKALALLLSRESDDISFEAPWSYYENGFGDANEGSFWAGLKNIFALTSTGYTSLYVNIEDWTGVNVFFFYNTFYLDGPSSNYRMHCKYNGTLPDDLSYQNNMSFATADNPDPNGCATAIKAGWWYNSCAYTLPTGKYYSGGWYTPTGPVYDGIFWKDWHGYNYSLQSITMYLSSYP